MSNVLQFPNPQPAEIINQAYFEQFSDAALLLKCFEVVKDTSDAIYDAEDIHEHDDIHVGLLEAFWALKVLYERQTGGDADKASAARIQALLDHYYPGVLPTDEGGA